MRALICCPVLVALAASLAGQEKEPPRRPPSKKFGAPLVSPEVHADRKVTFRLRAPSAKEVKVSGELDIGTRDMTRGEGGVWSVTVGPLAPEIYGYSFVVDGLRLVDPGNPRVKPQRSSNTSILDIPGDPPLVHDYQDVPHGTVRLHEYRSKALGGTLRRLRVYTPPGYDADAKARLPVLYLFHGSGDNEATWTELGRAHLILDNLIAAKKAVPMLVVMTDGHPVSSWQDDRGRAFNLFEEDLLKDVVPLVDSTYRTRADRLGRAIIGLSMGGMQSMTIGLKHPELFAHVGGMSAFIPDADRLVADGKADPKVNENLRLFWVAIGKDDFLLKRMEESAAVLKAKGLKHTYKVTEGNHSWPVWRKYLAEFAPLVFRE